MSAPQRRKTVSVDVGGVKVGGPRPIIVQSMTNTDTADVAGTVAQVNALHAAGSELVRVTVNTEAAARAVPEIVNQVTVPVIGDFHYNGHVLLTKYPEFAREPAPGPASPLHPGLTEGGMGAKGIVASTAGLAILLQEGIGDTIRVSLTPKPNGDRPEEVQVAQLILQSLGIRSFLPLVTACPGCGRTTSTFFQEMAEQIQTYLRDQMPVWKSRYSGVEELKVAVMGCVVNGPGESKHADIGISLPGTFEEPKAPVFVDGALKLTLKGDAIVADFLKILDDYVEKRYAGSRK